MPEVRPNDEAGTQVLDSAEVNRQCVRDLWTLAREFRRKGQTGMAALFQERARFYVRQLRKARGA